MRRAICAPCGVSCARTGACAGEGALGVPFQRAGGQSTLARSPAPQRASCVLLGVVQRRASTALPLDEYLSLTCGECYAIVCSGWVVVNGDVSGA